MSINPTIRPTTEVANVSTTSRLEQDGDVNQSKLYAWNRDFFGPPLKDEPKAESKSNCQYMEYSVNGVKDRISL